jgi:hypothetical protein
MVLGWKKEVPDRNIAVLAIFGGKRQLPPKMLPKIKLSAAIFCRRRIFVLLMMLHCMPSQFD